LSYRLDTDICSAYVKGYATVFGRFLQYGGNLHISTITLGELLTWGLRASAAPRRLTKIREFLELVSVLDVTPEVAWKFGEIRAALLDAGGRVPEMDLMIAASALVSNLTVVTHNTADFAQIHGLRLEDWLTP